MAQIAPHTRSRVLAPSLARLVREAVSSGELLHFYANVLENRFPCLFSSGLMDLRATTMNEKVSQCM